MKRPNFFILGAPKCGTTSLAAWLSEHPNVFFCPRKEPHHFCTDLVVRMGSRERYNNLYSAARDEHIAVGEGTVWYLYSEAAVPAILNYSPDARFIVCLRNPVQMAYSLHDQLVFDGHEHVQDFEKAWRLQEKRRTGQAVSKLCIEPKFLIYGDVCKLGQQLARLYQTVKPDQVLPVVLEDLAEHPRAEYRRILEFLSLPDDDRSSFPVHNRASTRKADWLRRMVRIVSHAQSSFGLPKLNTGVLGFIDDLNARERARQPLSKELRRELSDHFREDVKLLEHLLDRELDGWLE